MSSRNNYNDITDESNVDIKQNIKEVPFDVEYLFAEFNKSRDLVKSINQQKNVIDDVNVEKSILEDDISEVNNIYLTFTSNCETFFDSITSF